MNKDDRYMLYALTAFAGILAFGTVSYSWLEDWSLLDSLYFTLFSVLTIGFGDIVPSPENRLFTSLFILVCTTIVIACIASVGNWIVSVIQKRSADRKAVRSDEHVRRAMRALGGTDGESGLERLEERIADGIRKLRIPDLSIRCRRTCERPCSWDSRSSRRTSYRCTPRF